MLRPLRGREIGGDVFWDCHCAQPSADFLHPGWSARCLDPDDSTVVRRYRRIPEHGGRVLRVAVDTAVVPQRVVSVFFDRQMKDRL